MIPELITANRRRNISDVGTHLQAIHRFGGWYRYSVAFDGCDADVSREGH